MLSHDHPRFCDPDYDPYRLTVDEYDGPDYQGEVLAEEEALKREEQASAQEMTTAIENEEHGSDACRCGDFRSDHTDGKVCRVCALHERCTQFVFAYKADSADRAIWDQYHAPRRQP